METVRSNDLMNTYELDVIITKIILQCQPYRYMNLIDTSKQSFIYDLLTTSSNEIFPLY